MVDASENKRCNAGKMMNDSLTITLTVLLTSVKNEKKNEGSLCLQSKISC